MGNFLQNGFWENVAFVCKFLVGCPHSLHTIHSHFVADLCFSVDFWLGVIGPYYYNFLNLWQLYPRRVISDFQVFWKHFKGMCQMKLLMLFQIYFLSLLLRANQRAWEIILWLAFKTKPKQKLVSFLLFH